MRIHGCLALFCLNLLAVLLLAGCGSRDGRTLAYELASRVDLEPVTYLAHGFTLRGFLRLPDDADQSHTLVVYIEGDGHAYVNRYTPSKDPTPANPMSLRLALSDPSPALLYLGRPCQYTEDEPCSMRYWTVDRYSPVAVDAMSIALDQAKRQTGAKSLFLVGYSGGGAVAVLLAARRSDVAGLATVAGNLNHAMWTSLHDVSPLRGSLNPLDDAKRLRHLPQVHFVGEDDRVVPLRVAESYMEQLGEYAPGRIVMVEGVDHNCCWPRLWPRLLRKWSSKWGR